MRAPPQNYKPRDPYQLTLPIPGIVQIPADGVSIPRSERVFVNRNLRMSSIKWVGFDMDYTLAIYRQDAMDALSIQLTVERMIRRGYPKYLEHATFDTRFPIRGLLIDKRFGHVLKMNRHKVVLKGYHGMRRLSAHDLDELYQHKKLRPHTNRYHWIDTLFALCEVTSYAAIVEAMERRGERINYDRLFHDVRASIDEAHADGSVYKHVLADLPRYVDKDVRLARTLHKLRSAGKHLFVLTNSPWSYTNDMMTYLLGDGLSEYKSWRHYFDAIICAASKPHWFKEGRPLMERDGGVLKPFRGQLERGKIYEGGNLRTLENVFGVPGSSVLYVGDHIYGDILRSKKESTWRTAMIIQELDAEIFAYETCTEDAKRQRQLDEMRQKLEDELRFYQTRYKALTRSKDPVDDLDLQKRRTKQHLERVRNELRAIEREYTHLAEVIDEQFHPYWGSLLKEQTEMSIFGQQVNLYADIYMRRVSCLDSYSPEQFFRSPHDLMPHEL